jgi:class 3 adenylate cyclase
MRIALPQHDDLLRDAIQRHGGVVVKTLGDGFHSVFTSASDAILAAIAAQRALNRLAVATEAANSSTLLLVRMGIHTGAAIPRDGDYFGPTVNQAARIKEAANGRQILISQATRSALESAGLTLECTLRDLGEHVLRGVRTSDHLTQIVIPDLPDDMRSPRTDHEITVAARIVISPTEEYLAPLPNWATVKTEA